MNKTQNLVFKKALVVLMAVMMVFTMMPSMAWAAEDESPEDGAVTAAEPITVYVSVTADGELQKAKDDSYMAYKEVQVTDTDADGMISMHDAMLCLHQQYYKGYTEENPGYALADGEGAKGVESFWGMSKTDELPLKLCYFTTFKHGETVKSAVLKKDSVIQLTSYRIQDGDMIAISASRAGSVDPSCFSSYGPAFSGSKYLSDIYVPAGKNFSISLGYKPASGLPKKLDGYQVYAIDENGKEAPFAKTVKYVTNAVLTGSFEKSGEYLLLTKPSEQSMKYGVAVVRVHVYDGDSVQVSDAKVGITEELNSNSLISFAPDTEMYDVTISENDTALYGQLTFDSELTSKNNLAVKFELGSSNEWDVINGVSGTSGTTIKKGFWGDKTKTQARLTVADPYVAGGEFASYVINIKRQAVLTNLEVQGLILTEDFQPVKTEYTAILQNAAQSISITPSADAHSVQINGTEANVNEANEIAVSGLTFTADGKADITILVSDDRTQFVENTYHITVVKAPAEATPTFVQQPQAARYVKDTTAEKLVVYASASGNINYQWYRNSVSQIENAEPITGETSNTFTPPTDKAGTTYYFCRATNSENRQTTDSDIVEIKVYPDPTPTIRWETAIPELSEEDVAYLETKYSNGKLPDDAKGEDEKYHGYYYRQNDANPAMITAVAESPAEDGTMRYLWTRQNGTSSNQASREAGCAPDTSIAYGECIYLVQATYTLLGKPYCSPTISVYVYVDEPEVTLPDTITWSGSGTATDPYLLEDAKDLEELRLLVNDGYTFSGKYLALNKDISLDLKWKGIGNGDGYTSSDKGKSLKVFSGTLDGRGHTLTYAKGSKYPLFNYVREATVKNLTIDAPYINNYGLVANYVVDYGEDGDYNIGTGGSYAPGCPDTIDIDNVTIKSGSCIAESGFIGGGASGGNTVNITNCTIEQGVKIGCKEDGTPAGKGEIGSFAGSICGSVVGCTSYADVYGTGVAGGIVARKSQSMGNFRISNNAFLGSVQSTGSFVGGIVGIGYVADSAPNAPCVSITNCYVAADITGGNYVGGLFGGDQGVIQAWSNGVGMITDNFFYGTVTATKENGKAGALIGYMRSLNKYNRIENNYYLDTCGSASAIGRVDIVDTSQALSAEDTAYINTKGLTEQQLKELDKTIIGKTAYTYIAKADCNREDDPLGADAETLAKAMSAEAFRDGTVLSLLQNSDTSLKNWISGTDYPQLDKKPVALRLNLAGSYKTTYYIGESLDLTGMTASVTYSDGSVQPVDLADLTISGFDSSKRGVQTITVTYSGITTTYEVTILYNTSQVESISVYFTLLGDDEHGEPTKTSGTHTLKDGNLKEWIGRRSVPINNNTTVREVLEKVLSAEGYTWRNTSGNYVQGITKKGASKELAEFTNGRNSGWMYTLNGHHSSLGVAEQFLNDKDEIIFHYTDDYTVEEGSEMWNKPGEEVIEEVKNVTTDTKTGTTTAPTNVKVSEKTNADGTKTKVADVKVSADNQKEILKQAKASKSNEIILVVSSKSIADATKADVTLDKSFIDSIVKDTNAKLTFKTPFGDKTYTQEELKAMSEAATGSTITVAIEKAAEEPTGDAVAKIEKAKSIIKDMKLVARSSKTTKKNIKAVLKNDAKVNASIKELKDLGYTVKYRFYRSTKKAASYKSTVTKKTASYTNTSGKKGTKYFYKVQVRVYDENGKLIAKTALKQCKYASRTWSK